MSASEVKVPPVVQATPVVTVDDRQFMLITKALADPKRFEMLQRISAANEAPTCSCVADWTGLAAATISHHLKELDHAGLVNVERAGKFAHITLRRDVWNAYLQRLALL
jgi:ArsR family transcriptional regulator, arsenate/arsenite/antimonite-responsive transcriptional repressor